MRPRPLWSAYLTAGLLLSGLFSPARAADSTDVLRARLTKLTEASARLKKDPGAKVDGLDDAIANLPAELGANIRSRGGDPATSRPTVELKKALAQVQSARTSAESRAQLTFALDGAAGVLTRYLGSEAAPPNDGRPRAAVGAGDVTPAQAAARAAAEQAGQARAAAKVPVKPCFDASCGKNLNDLTGPTGSAPTSSARTLTASAVVPRASGIVRAADFAPTPTLKLHAAGREIPMPPTAAAGRITSTIFPELTVAAPAPAAVVKVKAAVAPQVPAAESACLLAVNGGQKEPSSFASMCKESPGWAPLLAGLVGAFKEQFGTVGGIMTTVLFMLAGLAVAVMTGGVGLLLKLGMLIGAGVMMLRQIWSLGEAIFKWARAAEGSAERAQALREIGKDGGGLIITLMLALAGFGLGKTAMGASAGKAMQAGMQGALGKIGVMGGVEWLNAQIPAPLLAMLAKLGPKPAATNTADKGGGEGAAGGATAGNSAPAAPTATPPAPGATTSGGSTNSIPSSVSSPVSGSPTPAHAGSGQAAAHHQAALGTAKNLAAELGLEADGAAAVTPPGGAIAAVPVSPAGARTAQRADFRVQNQDVIAQNLRIKDAEARAAAIGEQMPDLKPKQVAAVERAHEKYPCAGSDCTQAQLRGKYEEMQRAGMTRAQIEQALDRGLAGTEGTPPPVRAASPPPIRTMNFLGRLARMTPEEAAQVEKNPAYAKNIVANGMKSDNFSTPGAAEFRAAVARNNSALMSRVQMQWKSALRAKGQEAARAAGLDPERVISHGTTLKGFLGMLVSGGIESTSSYAGVSGESAAIWAGRGLDVGASYAAKRGLNAGEPGVLILMDNPTLSVQTGGETLNRRPQVDGDFVAAIVYDGEQAVILTKSALQALGRSATAWKDKAVSAAHDGNMKEFDTWEKVRDKLLRR